MPSVTDVFSDLVAGVANPENDGIRRAIDLFLVGDDTMTAVVKVQRKHQRSKDAI